MKIAFYRSIGIPFNGDSDKTGIGGLEVQAITLARKLSQLGYDISFFVGEDSGVYDGVKYKPLSEFQDDFDYLIGIDCLPDISLKKSKWLGWALTSGINTILDSDLIVCDSQWTLELYKREKPDNNYTMIPCGFDYDLYINDNVKTPNSIMFAGHPLKGMDKLPNIFQKVRNIISTASLNVYGGGSLWKDGNPSYQQTYNNLLDAGINYHGLVERQEIVNAFKTSEIYFLPRSEYTETFGLSVIEAMASGCVPILNKNGNLPNLIVKDSGIILEDDMDEAQTIIDLLSDKAKLVRLKWGAIQAVKQYDWSNITNLWQEILK